MRRYKEISINSKFRFKCTRKAFCCRGGPNVSLTVHDLIRIAKYLKKDWRELIPTYVKVIIADFVPFLVLRGIRDECVFLRKGEKGYECEIYPVRPYRCKLYPIVPKAIGSEEVYLDLKCPGLWEGPEKEVPKESLKRYYEEVKEHYQTIMKYVMEGAEPEEALEKAIEELWERVEPDSDEGLPP